MTDTKTVQLYNSHDGLTGRDGGPYLDQVEQREAEKRRALVEDREPDYEDMPATAGIPLVNAAQLIRESTSSNVPSQEQHDPFGDALKDLAAKKDFPVNVHSEIEVEDKSVSDDVANPTTASTDDDEDVFGNKKSASKKAEPSKTASASK